MSNPTVKSGMDHHAPAYAKAAVEFLNSVGASDTAVDNFDSADDYSAVLCQHLTALSVEPRRVSCSLPVKPAILNSNNVLFGGVVAAVKERVSMACARTVGSQDKPLFLGAPKYSELMVEGTVVRGGRNLTVVAVEFKIKDTAKSAYLARATFYNSPVSRS